MCSLDSSFSALSSLELGDTKVCEPYIRALLGTAEVKMVQMFGSIEAAVSTPCISGNWCFCFSGMFGENRGSV